jgi:hypothetical protein
MSIFQRFLIGAILVGAIALSVSWYMSRPIPTPEQIAAQAEAHRVQQELDMRQEQERAAQLLARQKAAAEAEAAKPAEVRAAEQNRQAVDDAGQMIITGLIIHHLLSN